MMPRDYEIAAGGGPLEFGGGGFITHVERRYVGNDRSDGSSKTLQGYSTLYEKPLYADGKYQILMPNAFDATWGLKSVRLLLDHDASQCIGSTDDILELHCDEHGIAFRAHLPNTDLGRKALRLAEQKDYTGFSIGFAYLRKEVIELAGKSVTLIHEALLHELSFVPQGAVADAYGVLVKGQRDTLANECKSGVLFREIPAINFVRALQKLEAALH